MALRVVREAPVIAFDTETSGVDWKVHSPVGYVITTDGFNCYIPVRHGGGSNLADPDAAPLSSATERIKGPSRFERELARAFQERRQHTGFLTVGHHLKFDMHMSANVGILLGRDCGDTQLNMAMLNEYARSFSLESAAKAEGVPGKRGEPLYEHISKITGIGLDPKKPSSIMEHFWRTGGCDPEVVDYSEGDGSTTLAVWHSQMEVIEAEEQTLIHEVESELIWTLFRMERRGIKVDERYIGDLTKTVAAEIEQAILRLPNNFNVRSATQMRQLFEDNGLLNWPTTPLGNPSFTEKFLKKSQPGRDVIAVRQLRNLLSSFVEPLQTEHMWNGRVHTNINQLKGDEYGTVGGRISCDHPNLLAVPKRNKEIGPRFRRCFVADDDMDFWEADYKQAEPVLFAHYSQDERLLAGYRATPTVDVHSLVAQFLEVERDPTAKRMNMGIFTGMQPKTFAAHMEWPLERATVEWNRWYETFPGVRDFQNRAKNAFASRGYVKTLLGRRCHLEHPRFAYRGTSRIIQGGNADIMKYKILECDRWLEAEGDKAHLLLSIYDSLEWQSPRGAEGEAISRELVRICTDLQGEPFNLRCPLGMDVDHGHSWAEATYGPDILKKKAA
jgi:DNA polymerase-1